MSEQNNEINTINLGDREFTPDELSSILSEYETLQSYKGKEDVFQLGSEISSYLSKGQEGIQALRNMLDETEQNLGYSRPKKTELDLALSEYATEDEKKLSQGLRQVYEMLQGVQEHTNMTKREMKELFSNLMEDITVDKTSSVASERVKIELGLSLTPAQVKEAMKETGLKDPVKAVAAHYVDEVKKSLSSPSKPKPNFVKTVPTKEIDFKNMSFAELKQYYEDNPQAVPPKKHIY